MSADRLPCPLCLKTFADGERLLSHGRRRHAGIALQWTCAVCAKQYDCLTWMRHRRRRHHQSDSAAAEEKAVDDAPNGIAGSAFSCSDCDRSFDSAQRLDRHRQRRHLPDCPISSDPIGAEKSDFQESNANCGDCGKYYLDEECLQRHRERRHAGVSELTTVADEPTASSERFECDECEKGGYASAERLERHKVRRHGSDQLSVTQLECVESVTACEKAESRIVTGSGISAHCTYCDKDFVDSERLERHRRRKHRMRRDSPVRVAEEKPLVQSVLDVAADVQSSECVTKSSACGNNAFVCGLCEKGFDDEERLERHRARRHSDRKMDLVVEEVIPVAPIISTDCIGSDSAVTAVAENSATNQLACNRCERSFAGEERLERHRKRKHAEGNVTIAHLPEVGAVVRTEAPVKRPRRKRFQEIVIGAPEGGEHRKDFLERKTLVRILPRPRIHECEQCGKRYKSALTRDVHLHRRHTGLTVYRCGICNWRTVHKSGILYHADSHRGGKPFACDICDSVFRTKAQRVIHMRIHTGERPFKCEMCDKAFRASAGLIVHRSLHSSERPFECVHCGSRFKSAATLYHHKRSVSICLRADALPKRNLEVMVASVRVWAIPTVMGSMVIV